MLDRRHPACREATTILYFATLAFLYVGMEASIGNWMSTYATRATAWTFAGSTLAVAIFWAALLLGRAITPVILSWVPERVLYRASVFATIAGVLLLLAAHRPAYDPGRIGSQRPGAGALVPAHSGSVPGRDRRVAQRGLGVCGRRTRRSRTVLVDGSDFERHRVSAHRPDGARGGSIVDVGDDQPASNEWRWEAASRPGAHRHRKDLTTANEGSWQGSCG